MRDLIASPEETVGALARAPMVVPMTKDLGALLRELREARQVMAVVVDEYGGTAGIVTLHDVLEELVGEIESEFDLPNNELTWIDDRKVEVSGSMTIDDFNEAVGTRLPLRGPRTLAGLAFDALGRRPEPGDVAQVDGVMLRIEEVQDLRITRLRIELSPVFSRGSGGSRRVEA